MDIAWCLDQYIKDPPQFSKRKKNAIMKKWKYISVALLFQIISTALWAQDGSQKVQMADTMRSNGRIYVVVAVMSTILIGLILYLVRLDRKISKLEKENK